MSGHIRVSSAYVIAYPEIALSINKIEMSDVQEEKDVANLVAKFWMLSHITHQANASSSSKAHTQENQNRRMVASSHIQGTAEK